MFDEARLKRPLTEALIAIALFACAAVFSMSYLAGYVDYPAGYWQAWWLAPSAMMATGHGFTDTAEAPQVLGEFLNRKIDALPPDSLPADLETRQPSAFHFAHRYLLYAVAAAWKLFGVSWKALLPVYGILCGFTAMAAYGLCRLGMGRALSVGMTTIFLLSPVHLYALPLLRDYGKAPFFLGCVFLLGYLIRYPVSFRTLLALAATLGGLAGIGIGFRMDVQIAYWGSVLALFLFLPGHPLATWKQRIAVVAVVVVACTITSWPIKHPPVTLNMSAHAAQGGFVENHHRQLGVAGVPYTWTRLMNDYLMFAVVETHAHFIDNEQAPVAYLSPEHQKAGWSYLKALVTHFPADTELRILASTLRILQQSPAQMHPNSPDIIETPTTFIAAMYRVFNPVYTLLPWLAPLCAAIAIVAMGTRCPRRGVALTVLLFMLGGYCFLQFEIRHYFHLAIAPLWFVGFVLSGLAAWLWRLKNPEYRLAFAQSLPRTLDYAGLRPMAGRLWGLAILLAVAVGIVVSLGVMRAVQRYQVGKLYDNYLQAERQPVEYEALPDTPSPGLTLLKPKGVFDSSAWPEQRKQWNTQTEMLAIEFEDPALERMWYWPRYTTPQKFFDLTHYAGNTRLAPRLSPRTFHFEPVFEAPDTFLYADGHTCGPRTFDGIAVLTSQLSGVKGLYRLPNPGALDFIMSVTLPDKNVGEVAQYERLQPYPLPAPMRALHAEDLNYLEQGGFETAAQDGSIAGFTAPAKASTVTQDKEFFTEGASGARQIWTEADAGVPPSEKFHTIMQGLQPGREYELFVKAKHTGPGSIGVEAWQLPEGTRIGRLFNVTPGEGFREYRGVFKAPEGPGKEVLLCTLLPAMPPDSTARVEVTWDDWCLTPAPEYGQVLRD